MNRSLLALLLLLVPAGACSTVDADYGPLSGTTRELGSLSGVDLRDPRVRYDDSGMAVYQITVVNEDDEQRWVEWRARWFDEQGFEVRDPSQAWRRVSIEPNSYQPLRSIGPAPQAMRCEIEIRDPQTSVSS